MIKKITKVLFSKYWRTLASMASKVLDTVKGKPALAEAIGKTLQKSEDTCTTLNDAITKLRRNEFTIQLNEADGNRDTLYRAFVMRLESDMLCFYDPQLQQTAKELYEIVENNGKALKRGADDESNQLANLFRKIDEKVESFRNTSIESIYNNLKNAESEFLAIQKKLYAYHLDKKSIPNAKDAANDLIDQFNERLIPRLNTEADENPGLYDEEIAMINLIIDKTEKVQRARIARNDATDEPVEITEDKELQNTP